MKSLKKKYIIIIIIGAIFILLFFLIKFAIFLGSPSYGWIEYYKFNISYTELVSEVEKFKELHPELNPPKNDPIFGNSKYNPNEYMSPMFFYYSDKQRVLYTVVVETPKKDQSSLGFYKILDPKDRSTKNDEEINNTLGCSDNRKQLKLFEERIVNPLHKQIREKYKNLKPEK